MFTIGFVRNNEVYATLRGWLYQSTAIRFCNWLNGSDVRPEFGRYDYTIIIEINP
jgi:hypothetical protein